MPTAVPSTRHPQSRPSIITSTSSLSSRSGSRFNTDVKKFYSPADIRAPYRMPSPSPTSSVSSSSRSSEEFSPISSDELEEDEEEELVTALHSFVPVSPSPNSPVATCLSFRAGQIIRVLNKDPTGWWDGELIGGSSPNGAIEDDGVVRRGWFPSNYVSSHQSLIRARLPKKSSTTSWVSSTSTTTTKMSSSELERTSSLSPSSSLPPRSSLTPSSSLSSSSSTASSSSSASAGPLTPNTSVDTSASAPTKDALIPPLLHPLLHGLSLLQTAVQNGRSAHYQPSAACIIGSVRTILTESGCLAKDAPRLNGPNGEEIREGRRVVLSVLAELVQVAQQASAFARQRDEAKVASPNRDLEEDALLEHMLRIAGGVFSATRQFLNLLDKPSASSVGHSRTSSIASTSSSVSNSQHVTPRPPSMRRAVTGPVPTPSSPTVTRNMTQDDITITSPTPNTSNRRDMFHRARSMGDLRKSAASSNGKKSEASTPRGTPRQSISAASTSGGGGSRGHQRYPNSQSFGGAAVMEPPPLPKGATGMPSLNVHLSTKHHKRGSMSSATTASSISSYATPPTPPFPSGPCTSEQVLTTLRTTQDHLLSTVAAFIGHIHNHSRSAHSTSKGNIIFLATETVERVKMLLALVDSVLKHPDVIECVAPSKITSLSNAKYNLFLVTNELVAFVRNMTAPVGSSMTMDEDEQEEKNQTLNAATGILRAGRDCFSAVNIVLGRAAGEKEFLIHLPDLGNGSNSDSVSNTPATTTPSTPTDEVMAVTKSHSRKQSLGTVKEFQEQEEQQKQAQYSSFKLLYGSANEDSDEEQEDTVTQEGVVAVIATDRTPVPTRLSREMSSAATSTAEDTDCGDDSMLSFDSSETEEEDESPSGDDLHLDQSRPVVVDPPGRASISHSDEDASSAASFQTSITLEEKIHHGELPSIPLSPRIRATPTPSRKASVSETVESLPSTGSLFDEVPQPQEANPDELMYNNDGMVVGATLKALVEKMTPQDAVTDGSYASVFFLTFRFFAPPAELLNELINRFKMTEGFAVRIRVSNFIKLWLEVYWHADTDNFILPRLLEFVRSELATSFPGPSTRIEELIRTRLRALEDPERRPVDLRNVRTKSATDRLREIGSPVSPVSPSEIPRPQITKSLFNQLRSGDYDSINITDFDALELARQITILENSLYRAVLPEEILEVGQSGAPPAVHVKAISSLSTAITGWVTESILSEQDTKKRASLLKYFIKVAERCSRLNNFSTPWSILASLNSSTISRLKQTWAMLPQKQRLQFEELRKLSDHGRNYAEYRSKLRNTAAPAVPFLGLYLTDITFCREGNPSHRTAPGSNRQLINFNKYHKLARIVQDMQRFQTPFTLKEISEVQQYLKHQLDVAKSQSDLQDLYRRSLVVEPRQPADIPPSGEVRQLFGWGSRSTTSHTHTQSSSTTAPVSSS